MDRYTKTALTVIAVCLVIQTSRSLIEPAFASDVQRVAICNVDSTTCVKLMALGDNNLVPTVAVPPSMME